MSGENNQHEHSFECPSCLREFKPSQTYTCKACGDLLQISYNYEALKDEFRPTLSNRGPLSVWRYRQLLPVSEKNAITIGEGGTGLPQSKRLVETLNLRELYFKNEGQNPTGSFKDRGMTVAVTRAVEVGAQSILCASTGNTSASMAAYAAKAGLKAAVLIPKGKIAKGKLVQAIVHGAEIREVDGNFDEALKRARTVSVRKNGVYLANSINPYRLEGQKTIAFEIWEQLGREIPDFVVLPVGNAGNISAIWKGFKELMKLKIIDTLPRLIGVQAAGAAPIATAFANGSDKIQSWPHPETSASAIRIGAPARWKGALTAIRDSKGTMLTVTDNEIKRAQRRLADHEGIFAEPASAASVAGLTKACKSQLVEKNNRVICIITGHGLKDQKAIGF